MQTWSRPPTSTVGDMAGGTSIVPGMKMQLPIADTAETQQHQLHESHRPGNGSGEPALVTQVLAAAVLASVGRHWLHLCLITPLSAQ